MRQGLVLATLMFAASAFCQAAVRVGLFQKELPLAMDVSCENGLRLVDDENGREIGSRASVQLERRDGRVAVSGRWFGHSTYNRIRIEPVSAGDSLTVETAGGDRRTVEGKLIVEARPRELLAINEANEESYVAQAAAGEIPSSWPSEALKAQAIVARTYLERHRKRHTSDGYDLCDITHCQVMSGKEPPQSITEAVRATAGMILTYQGRPIESLFHSTCGGATSSNHHVWVNQARVPYLAGAHDGLPGQSNCAQSPYFRWTLRVPRAEIEGLSQAWGLNGRLDRIYVQSQSPSGRVTSVVMEGLGGHLEIPGEKFYLEWGRRRGWHELKSRLFDLHFDGSEVTISGRGLGHGVGLCQYGARAQADRGRPAAEILLFYFPGTTVQNMVTTEAADGT